ncbi:hypothetical protein [Tenacibaculum sp. nBUS_03]|uniref:hypothetical protein n=1 Tax=Tenacibaculum sp. nBUS_03 TaxID=3395320 RepID=UPI003EBA5A7B
MDKSLLNKVLIFVVLIVWGLIVYKYWFSTSSITETSSDTTSNIRIIDKPNRIKEVIIEPVFRDPFLNKSVIVKKHTKNIKKNVAIKKNNLTKKATNFIWPRIKYLGFLKRVNGAKKILLTVNGKFLKLSEDNYILEDIEVKEVFKDSIIIKKNNIIKTIKKRK